MLALPIFPSSYPLSIVGADELNFCVRDGNRWTLIAINTNSVDGFQPIVYMKARRLINSEIISLSKPDVKKFFTLRSDLKTCFNRLTNKTGAPSGTRTRDPLIKSQLLYQLS